MKALEQRFTQWYNRRANRQGTLWEGRYKSVIVQDENRALRTMSTYIDLNPVRAGIVDDPGDYRWCGYAEAMAGKPEAMQGIVAISGATVEAVQGRALGAEAPLESTAQKKRRHLKALVMYRQLLGIAGRPRQTEDGRVVKRGVSEKVQARLAEENGVTREQLLRRVKHFTRGVVIGSKGFVDDWLERNRSWLGGASAKNRKTGARRIDRTWGNLHNLRDLRE